MTHVAQIDLEACLPRFGLSGFRPGQREVIEAVMAGEDCLCVMPTGGGKSLCYQLPSIARAGLTLVVSPLIALMKDQVDQLTARNIPATFINSTLTGAEQAERLSAMAAGEYNLVYVVPERFRSPRFLDALGASRLQLLAIDEAHCISEWGHDFRPDYARLGRYRERLGNPPTIALTATATDDVRRDVVEQLGLREPKTFITGFIRPNLHYAVLDPGSMRRKDEELAEFIKQHPGSGIVYASTRKRCEEVAALIATLTGRKTCSYHAGMPNEERRATQDSFMQGRYDIVVATTAFGMGIDKADVRFVVHYNLPGSLEGYYQEAGRAGRDGQPAHCLLLFNHGDRKIQEFFIESAYPARDVVAKVYEHLRGLKDDPIQITQEELKERLGIQISSEGVGTCERLLEKAGVIERLESYENQAMVRLDSDLPTLVDLLPREAKSQRRVLQTLERIVGPRRYELVYFQPRELISSTEMDQTAVTRALRELRNLKAFDYVPPFRGRAIHLVESEIKKPFSQLNIDFELLERRKAAEYEKLHRVLSFCRTSRCRQQDIVEYFGQRGSAPCQRCDNCNRSQPVRAATSAANAAAQLDPRSGVDEAVRKALSGVARARGRFGKNLVAQMLFGSKSAKITRFGLQRLTTYGLMKPLSLTEITELLDALQTAGCLMQAGDNADRPTLQLTDLGREAMSGRVSVAGRLNITPTTAWKIRAAATGSAAPASASELEHEPEQANGTASPQPRASATPKPAATPSTEKRSYDDEPPEPETPPTPVVNETVHPSHYWTWRLLAAGFSVSECEAIRSLEREVVMDHALRAIDSGWQVEARWFLPPEHLAALEKLIGAADPARIRPLLSQLPKGVRYEDVQLFLKCRRSPKPPGAEPVNRQ